MSIVGGAAKNPFIGKIIELIANYYTNLPFRLKINQYSMFDANKFDLMSFTDVKIARLTYSRMILELCDGDKISECNDIIVFPPNYFESPFMTEIMYKEMIRPYYNELRESFDINYDIYGN